MRWIAGCAATSSLRWGTSRVGVVTRAQADGLPGGPVARASGDDRDARRLDPAYQRLGFEPVVRDEGDALARWRLRVAEARQSLQLAKRSGTSESTPSGVTEGPRGPLARRRAPQRRTGGSAARACSPAWSGATR